MAVISETHKTLSEIRDYVLFLMRETIDTFPNIDSVINMGFNQVWDKVHTEPYVISRVLTPGTVEYDLPNANVSGHNGAIVNFVILTYTDESGEIQRVQLQEGYYSLDDPTVDAGIPESYSVNGNSIFFSPSPDSAFAYSVSVGYKKDFTPLLADEDFPEDVSMQEIEAAVFYTCYMLKLSDDEFDASDRYKMMYDEVMAKLLYIAPGVYPFESLYGGAV